MTRISIELKIVRLYFGQGSHSLHFIKRGTGRKGLGYGVIGIITPE